MSTNKPLNSYNDAQSVRTLLVQTIKRCPKSRAAIASEMESLLGRTFTEKMLNAFTAVSREDRRWPAEFDRAFCQVTNDYSLLATRVERAGFRMIGPEEERLIEIGRAFVARAAAQKLLREASK